MTNPVDQRFRRLIFFQVLIGILAFTIADGQPLLLMIVGLLCVAAWFVTEGKTPRGLPRPMLNLGAVFAVGLVMLEYRITRGARPVALVGHLTIALQVLILFGKRERREYAQLALLSPLQMISASVLPGGVTLIYGILLVVYCAVTLTAAVASQAKRAGDLVYERQQRGARGMEGDPPQPPDPTTGAHYRLQRRSVMVGIMATCALVAVAVFLVAPRTERSQFASTITQPPTQRLAGFSKTVELNGGSIGEGSPEPVLNLSVSIDGYNVGHKDMHWLVRGSVLDEYDSSKRSWVRSHFRTRSDVPLLRADRGIALANANAGTRMRSEVTLRRLAEHTVFVPVPIDGPVALSWFKTPSLQRVSFGGEDQQIIAASPMSSVHTYSITTWVRGAPDVGPAHDALVQSRRNAIWSNRRGRTLGQQLTPAERAAYSDEGNALLLRWEPEHDAVQRYAQTILERAGLPTDLSDASPEQRLAAGRALSDHLRTRFRYTTSNPRAQARDPVASFLFSEQAGHCELFASGLCALCRTVGIPTRIATGFRASEYNDIGGYYVVRQSHAHAWTEIDLGPGAGWHTLDATPPADVDRQHQTSTGLLAGVRELYDHFEFRWISTVITYDEFAQEKMLGAVGAFVTQGPDRWANGFADWADRQAGNVELDTVGYVSLGLLSIALLIAIYSLARLLILRHRRMVALQLTALPRAKRRGLARQLRFYIAMLETLERHGHVRPHWQSPYGFAQELAHDDPMCFDPVVALTELFYEVRFGYRHLDEERRGRVKVHLRRLEQTLAEAARLARSK
ncbi:MAG: DUF3488 and DUF4129 domain-containing transglutaminase family protein [Phycisphaerales bacterium JB063]